MRLSVRQLELNEFCRVNVTIFYEFSRTAQMFVRSLRIALAKWENLYLNRFSSALKIEILNEILTFLTNF